MRLHIPIPLLFVALIGLLTLSCSEKPFLGEAYKGWVFHTNENIKIYYRPGHPQEDRIPEMSRQYHAAINQICTILKMDRPTDTMVIVYYPGYKTGREMTGREYPFAEDSIVYFWQPSWFGPALMRYMIPRWSADTTRFPFLYHGLIAALDFSGQFYHGMVMQHLAADRYVPLAELPTDTAVNSDLERLESAEGASFIAYLLEAYRPNGVEKLKSLYEADEPFPEAVRDVFDLSVDSLERAWLAYARDYPPPRPDTTAVHDTTNGE